MNRLITSITLFAMTATQAFANPDGTFGGGVAAPGPIAGAGLAYLALAGGYYAVRRWRKS